MKLRKMKRLEEKKRQA